MQMHVDHARQNRLSRNVERFACVGRRSGREDCGDAFVLDRDVRRDTVGVRQNDRAPANDQVKAHSALYSAACATLPRRNLRSACVSSPIDLTFAGENGVLKRAHIALCADCGEVGAEFLQDGFARRGTPRSAEHILDIDLARVAVSECDMDARLEAVREIRAGHLAGADAFGFGDDLRAAAHPRRSRASPLPSTRRAASAIGRL